MKLAFLGAARQVTGSSYLVETDGLRILVDCGLYQERRSLSRNWDPFPVRPGELDALLLTHAHLDHSGLIPRLVRDGFAGTILATPPTADILSIALMDAAEVQAEDAAFKKRRHEREGRTVGHPVAPLYTAEDVAAAMPLVEEIDYDAPARLGEGVSVRFLDAGHILGSAMIEVTLRAGGDARTLVFSGDIGQWDMPFVCDPTLFEQADYVIMESTYGDREHEDPGRVGDLLAGVIRETAAAGGNVVIPTFAIERAQDLMFHLSRLVYEKAIPALPVFLDSPMAREVTLAFERHDEFYDDETRRLMAAGRNPFRFPGLTIVRTTEESKALNQARSPAVIMAGSGMITGGRIKHHIARNITRPESTILFVGYQARDTLGRLILEGTPEVRILGQVLPVRARVTKINGFSAHADRRGLARWLDGFKTPPRRLFVTHGDQDVSAAFAERIRRERRWTVEVPEYLEVWDLD
jgi:metallo-beta-lactamase family protein